MKARLSSTLFLFALTSCVWSNVWAYADDAAPAPRATQVASTGEIVKPAAVAPVHAARQHLPLDHGPRAEVTPWVNEQRRLRMQQDDHAALAANDAK